MAEESIIKEARLAALEGMRKVMEDKDEKYSTKLLAPNDLIQILEKEFKVKRGEFDSNGWQYDNWTEIYIDKVKYVVSGSGYYGGTTFYKSDNE